MKKINIDYFTLNAKVLPPSRDSEATYSSLINNWFSKGFKIETKGDNRHYFSLRVLEKIEQNNQKYFYGIITKYLSFEDIDFYEKESGRLIEHPIPPNVEGRVNDYEFIFFPLFHRFAFIKIGKLDVEIKKSGAPLKKLAEIVKLAFDNGLESGEYSIVEIVQDNFVFEQIFENTLLSMEIRVSYTNADHIKSEAKQIVDTLLKESNVGEFFARLKPDNTGEIDTTQDFSKGLLELAKENGHVKARIDTPEGEKTIDSIEFPEVNSVTAINDENRKYNIIEEIISKFKLKYETFRTRESE